MEGLACKLCQRLDSFIRSLLISGANSDVDASRCPGGAARTSPKPKKKTKRKRGWCGMHEVTVRGRSLLLVWYG